MDPVDPAVGSDVPADLVLLGGSVATMDAVRRWAQAVAIRDGRIVAVGRDAEVRRSVGPRTRVVDLAGRTLLPGFQDAHVHPAMAAIDLQRCTLHEVEQTEAACLAAVAEYAAAHPELEWITGAGWYMAAFPGGTPSRAALDRVVADRPAFLVNRDGHGAWVNSRALAMAGIERTTPDPPHGRIERDPSGEPTGTLHEGAMELVRGLLPSPPAEERVRGLEMAQAYLHRFGITAWQDAWVTREDLEAYRTLVERGRLTARVVAAHWWDRERGEEQIEDIIERRRLGAVGRLRADSVKIMQDGVAEVFTAAMLEPYLDGSGAPTANRGLSFVDPARLGPIVTRLDAEGFQVQFHALGDRAVREALDAIEAARRTNGPSDGRHELAHLQVVDPADIPRFRALGAVATIQPYWACHEPQMDVLTVPFLGPERVARQYPFRSLRRAGATLAGGSDWMVSTPNVMAEVELAVTRVSDDRRDAPPFLPQERLEPIDALAAFTIGSAYANHLDRETGSIEVDKLADLVVLDRDVFGPGAGPLGDARVLLTLIEGQAVHEDPALEHP